MDLFTALGIFAFAIIIPTLVIMYIGYKQFTKGLWKQYTMWLVISGTLMTVYLFSFVIAKMGFYPRYYNHILMFGFLAESIAALTYIKSSEILRTMANKFGFAHKPIHETLKLGEEKSKIIKVRK